VVARFQQKHPLAPVIVITGAPPLKPARFADQHRALVFDKAFATTDLVDAVTRLLEGSGSGMAVAAK
jgi:hypothetical protein